MQIGELNVVTAIIDLEVQVGVLQKSLDHSVRHDGRLPNQTQINHYLKEVQKDIQKKYPSLNLSFAD